MHGLQPQAAGPSGPRVAQQLRHCLHQPACHCAARQPAQEGHPCVVPLGAAPARGKSWAAAIGRDQCAVGAGDRLHGAPPGSPVRSGAAYSLPRDGQDVESQARPQVPGRVDRRPSRATQRQNHGAVQQACAQAAERGGRQPSRRQSMNGLASPSQRLQALPLTHQSACRLAWATARPCPAAGTSLIQTAAARRWPCAGAGRAQVQGRRVGGGGWARVRIPAARPPAWRPAPNRRAAAGIPHMIVIAMNS